MKSTTTIVFLLVLLLGTQAVRAQIPALPPITGRDTVCVGATTPLSDTTTGGTWTSSNTAVATVDRGRGVVRGISAGTAVITYDVSGSDVFDVVTVEASPSRHAVTGGGTYCSGRGGGVRIGLAGSDTGVKYQLYDGITAVGGAMDGTDTALNFGLHTAAGTYRIVATDSTSGCSSRMSGSAVIVVDTPTLPTVTISTGVGDTVCAGVMTTFTAIPTGGGTAPTYAWAVNRKIAGSTSSVYSYVPSNNDTVIVLMVSNSRCTIIPIAVYSVTMTVDSISIPVLALTTSTVGSLTTGQADTVKAIVTGGGPVTSYTWYKNGTIVPGATGSKLVITNPVNKDSISCVVRGSGRCSMPTFNSVILQVSPAGVTNLNQHDAITVVPNPNNGKFVVKGNVGSVYDEAVSVTVSNMMGQVVYNKNATAIGGIINEDVQLTNTVAGGMYLLNVRSASGNHVFHIVIEQ